MLLLFWGCFFFGDGGGWGGGCFHFNLLCAPKTGGGQLLHNSIFLCKFKKKDCCEKSVCVGGVGGVGTQHTHTLLRACGPGVFYYTFTYIHSYRVHSVKERRTRSFNSFFFYLAQSPLSLSPPTLTIFSFL